MKAATAVTLELDEIPLAASELTDQIRKRIALCKNSVGFLFCDSEIDPGPLLQALEEKFSFPILGCTSIGILDEEHGFNEPCASLTVLSADDCQFHICLSEPVTPGNVESVIENTYTQAVADMGEKPKLIYALPSYQLGIMLDVYPEVLGRISSGVPVFGGVPSASADGVNAVYIGGQLYYDRFILLFISGNVRPLFSTNNVLLKLAEQKRTVTSAKDNVIYRVGDMTFIEYLETLGFQLDFTGNQDNTLTFVSNPLLVENTQDENYDGVPIVRTLHALNMEEGSGTAIGRVPQGSTISVGILSKKNIQSTAKVAIDELMEKIHRNDTDDYRYSVILCTSCIGRFLVMTPESHLEGKVLTEAIGDSLALSGFYGYGEICPTSTSGGNAVNRAHNESITLCAL